MSLSENSGVVAVLIPVGNLPADPATLGHLAFERMHDALRMRIVPFRAGSGLLLAHAIAWALARIRALIERALFVVRDQSRHQHKLHDLADLEPASARSELFASKVSEHPSSFAFACASGLLPLDDGIHDPLRGSQADALRSAEVQPCCFSGQF